MGVAITGPSSMASSLGAGGGAPATGDMNDPAIREMTRTPVNALTDQFQNGMYLHDGGAGGGSGGGSYHRNMNRSRSPGRELDSQPQQHSVRIFLPYSAPTNWFLIRFESV